MSEQNELHLDQFYFGNLVVTRNRVSATTGIVARTPGVTSSHATECVQIAKLRPPMPDEASGAMPAALGLFRGNDKSADFIFAKAQRNRAGFPQVLYILMPASELRKLGGNVQWLHALGTADMPAFTQVNKELARFHVPNVAPPNAEAQNDALMDLLLYCQDSFSTVESLLAAIVQGWPLAIVNSPVSLEKRLQFLQGLLSLLPVPARSGITFATHVSDFETGQVQIKFSNKADRPDKHIVYDWGHGTLHSPPVEHPYSRYIVSQMRLDASRVIQETERLAHTAVWRATHRENLGKALEWVSRRAALDQTVRNGQPADSELVAAVLREDPTLPDDLRAVYVRHVLAFALALKEAASADVVAVQCAAHQDLAPKVIEQLRTALESSQPRFVYSVLERWILRVPDSYPDQWHRLLHDAANTHLSALLQVGQIKRAQRFLAYLHTAPDPLRIADAMRDLILTVTNAPQLDSDLAQQAFLFGTEFLSVGALDNLFLNTRFVKLLPESLQSVIAELQSSADNAPSRNHLLHEAARAFGDTYRIQVLTRLIELAAVRQRSELIDTPALQALLALTQSPRSEEYLSLVQQVIDEIIEFDDLRRFAPPGPRILIQLMLQTHDYEHAVAMLEYYQNTIFGTDNLDDFILVMNELFNSVVLPSKELITALKHFENSQIRPKVRAVVYANSLANHEWSDVMDYAAQELTTITFKDHTIINTIGSEKAVRLLEYHARPHNALDALRVATGLIDHVVHEDTDNTTLLARMWPLLTWDEEITSSAIELLRRYVRSLPMRKAPKLILSLGKELGREVEEILQAAYIMRFITDDASLFEAAEVIHTAAELLTDLATAYHSNKKLPTIKRLRRDLDTMPGGLGNEERHEVAENVLAMASQIYELGTRRTSLWNKPTELEPLVQGKKAPESSAELLVFIGGHFSHRQAHTLELDREEMAHLFGTRSAAMVHRETGTIMRLLQRLQQASQYLEHNHPGPSALRAEINSLWDMVSLYNQRQVEPLLARDCQQLAGVIDVMANNVNDRAFSNSNVSRQLELGKRQPRSALETLRWIHGYFAHKHAL